MPVIIGGDNLPSPVRIRLTDLTNIGGASGPPGPPGSSITALVFALQPGRSLPVKGLQVYGMPVSGLLGMACWVWPAGTLHV